MALNKYLFKWSGSLLWFTYQEKVTSNLETGKYEIIIEAHNIKDAEYIWNHMFDIPWSEKKELTYNRDFDVTCVE